MRDASNDSVSYNQILGNTKPRTRDAAKLEAIHRDLQNYRDTGSNKDLQNAEGVSNTGSLER